MAQISTYFQPMSFRLLFISRVSCPAFPLFRNLGHAKVWMYRIHSPAIQMAAPSTSSFKLYFQRILRIPNSIRISGKIIKWNIIGGSVVLGLVSIFPRISYSLEGFQNLLDNHPSFSGNSKFKEDKISFLAFVKKFMLALFAIATVLTKMDHPVKLAAKLTVVLLSSKPSPSSVYFIIEQCRHQYMQQNPLWYKFKGKHSGFFSLCDSSTQTSLYIIKRVVRGQIYCEVEKFVAILTGGDLFRSLVAVYRRYFVITEFEAKNS